jgi:hypothetical protein
VYSRAHMLGWAHTGQALIHHFTSGPFTSYSKGRDHQNQETPQGGPWPRRQRDLEKGVTLIVANSRQPHKGDSDSQDHPLPDLFPAIPSTSAESINPISNESPPADPTSEEYPTANPTFNESSLSTPTTNPVYTTAPKLHRSHRISTLPSHLRDFHCFFVFATLHEPHTFREASSNPYWQQAMKEELDALL